VLAQHGLTFDLSTSSGKLMRTIMAGLAEFERDLIRERAKSGLAAAKARGVRLGRQHGQRPSDEKAKKVFSLYAEGLSYRLIARNLGLSTNTVMKMVSQCWRCIGRGTCSRNPRITALGSRSAIERCRHCCSR
jgi:DNA invertase Pin-like site-specific DNA recombinase